MDSVRNNMTDIRRQRLADKWVKETEEYLNAHYGASKEWPEKMDPRGYAPHRRAATDRIAVAFTGSPVQVRPAPNATWLISLRGDEHGHLDADRVQVVVEELRSFVEAECPGHVIFDLAQIESCTADLLQLLADVQKRIGARNGRMVLCQVRPVCAEMLETSGLPEVIDCYESVEQALEVGAA